MASPDQKLVLRPRLQSAEYLLRPTLAEVDLEAIAHNFGQVRSIAGAEVLAVVKADAYGHGAVPVVERLERAGAKGFAVALAEEAIELRDAGVRSPILILNGVVGGAHREVLERDLVPVVYDLGELEAFQAASNGDFRVHLKVDTGMARLGVPMTELPAFLEAMAAMPGLVLSGLMTHLAAADTDDEFTDGQLERFDEAIAMVRAAGYTPSIHAANSPGALRFERARYDMVRAGIALYGEAGFSPSEIQLKPALRLRTRVISVRHLATGERAGYDCAFVAKRPTRLAVLPIGYADGVFRSMVGGGEVLVGGQRCPYVGRISMDLSHVDVTDVPGAKVGDEVVLLGGQGDEMLHARELAEAAGTIAYEIMTSISRRVPRFYSS
ncbi:MAG: alanine racemase [Polyangiales bacterium]